MLGDEHKRKGDREVLKRFTVSPGWGGHPGRSRQSKTESGVGPGACAFVRVYGGVLCGFQAKAGLEFW